MRWIRIEGLRPFDGRYEFNLDAGEFTTREWQWIKKHAGYMPLTIEQGAQGGDIDLIVAFTAIALYRAARLDQAEVASFVERVQDVDIGAHIAFDAEDVAEEADASPPPPSSDGSSSTSGDASPTSSEILTNGQKHSGTPSSATSPSDPATWAT
jgi:hypothetical protein